jgi:hypothetical protein
LIIGSFLAVSTVVLTHSDLSFAARSVCSSVRGVEIHFEIQGFGLKDVIASLDATPQ